MLLLFPSLLPSSALFPLLPPAANDDASYIWNAAENATAYNQLTIGVFLQELAQNFRLFRDGGERFKLRFFVGHDGTMVRVASALGFGKLAPLRWPALGSEIVMEVGWFSLSLYDFLGTLMAGIMTGMEDGW